jgi:hypothetical protein
MKIFALLLQYVVTTMLVSCLVLLPLINKQYKQA